MSDHLEIQGLKENNLKNITVNIPHNQLVAITGLSGSGKSTLAFDTVYAEGGRRYIETFSPYTRQFLDRLKRPEVDVIDGIRPALAVEQRNRITNSRSTVGTVTEIDEYLKNIWARKGKPYCETCKKEVSRDTPESISHWIKANAAGPFAIGFEARVGGDVSAEAIKETFLTQGILRAFQNNQVVRIEDLETVKGNLTLLLARFTSFSGQEVFSALSQALELGKGTLRVVLLDKKPSVTEFSVYAKCDNCGHEFGKVTPSVFSYNSSLGACEECRGFGATLEISPELVIKDNSLSIRQGAISCWDTPSTMGELRKLIKFCEEQDIPTDEPWSSLKNKEQQQIFEGKGSFRGVTGWFKRLERKAYKMHVRVFLSRFRTQKTCHSCGGGRIRKSSQAYRVNSYTLPEIWELPLSDFRNWLQELHDREPDKSFRENVFAEVLTRANYLNKIGLGYLTLGRQSRTLSGGETQRVNLTTVLGSRLINTTLVLDEPTVGLHHTDTSKLIEALKDLKKRGNSVLVVEHDTEVIKSADQIIDVGPRSGEAGGEIVYQGPPENIIKSSLTAKYLVDQKIKDKAQFKPKNFVTVKGASAHNLKNIDVKFPLNALVTVCGVSGSGKSTLVKKCLYGSYLIEKQGYDEDKETSLQIKKLDGLSKIDEIVLADQSPVAKNPRSNPATYTKAWDYIREYLAGTSKAQALGLTKSDFSFNVEGGRCPECSGAGSLKIEMQFLSDVYVECETCGGRRFQDKVLEVEYKGKSVVDFLEMSLDETLEFFKDEKDVANRLAPLRRLGLGYLRLGQPISTLSGGEAQRVKLASYLGGSKRKKILFILDEPTTGLHPYNVEQLLDAIRELISAGHSVICVEHNLELIRESDYLIELGPEAGASGGEVVASGTPKELEKKSRTLQIANRHKSKKETAKREEQKSILIKGAREHNLKNVDLEIPLNKITAITGVSGSGKSTLAFDILFAEGQRRYIDCLSPYARQFIRQLERPEVDVIDNTPPTVAVSQKAAPHAGPSTVATVTDSYQFLRLLYAKVGVQHCPEHDLPIERRDASELAENLISEHSGERVHLFAPVVRGRKGIYNDLFQKAVADEIFEARVDGKIIKLDESLRLKRNELHDISLLVSSLTISKKSKSLFSEALDHALLLGGGELELCFESKTAKPVIYSTARACPECGKGFRRLDPHDFSFRSKRGMCLTCLGQGGDCPDCDGSRLKPEANFVTLFGKTIFELTRLNASSLLEFFDSNTFDKRLGPVTEPVLKELVNRLKVICSVGLDYLSLDRDASTLSGGEAQRLRLAQALGSPLTGVCYIFDEPTIGLHPSEHARVMKLFRELKDQGNTVIIVEHDEETIKGADHLIDVGPGGGANGGEVIFTGKPKDILKSKVSKTGQCLASKKSHKLGNTSFPEDHPEFGIEGATLNNLKNVSASFPLNSLTVVCGVSGAGKSSLVHEFLSCADDFDKVLEIDQSPVSRSSTSSPSSYLGIFNEIRKVYAMLPEAKARGMNLSYFSYNTGKGRCKTCGGRGHIVVPMSFLPNSRSLCESCRGGRYTDEVLEVTYKGLSISDALNLTFEQAGSIFENYKKIKKACQLTSDLGVQYLTLGQEANTLSGGEAQRLKIARELLKTSKEDTLYVFDEPTVGLHMSDVEKLIAVFRKLIDRGGSVLVIEHDMDVIRSADFLIEMGPEAAEAGGEVVFAGSPASLKKRRKPSYTKDYL